MCDLRPDIYIAAMGRSGSTMLCNALTHPPEQIVFIEPGFHTPPYRNMLKPQLTKYGMQLAETDGKETGRPPNAELNARLGADLRNIKWGFKEVQCSEHAKVLKVFNPKHVLVNVRHIRNVALSFLEKHQRQNNEAHFPPSWVEAYCLRESRDLVALCKLMDRAGQEWSLVRYEDFTRSQSFRAQLAQDVGWKIGGQNDQFFGDFNRSYEANRHNQAVFHETQVAQRNLSMEKQEIAVKIEAESGEYQEYFGYKKQPK